MLAFPAQADIFSLGIVLFELFLRKTMAALIMEGDYDPGLVEMFAYKVHQRTNEGYIIPHVPPLTMLWWETLKSNMPRQACTAGPVDTSILHGKMGWNHL